MMDGIGGNGQSDVFTFFAVSRSIFKMAVSSFLFGLTVLDLVGEQFCRTGLPKTIDCYWERIFMMIL